jgi:hypothetical protein
LNRYKHRAWQDGFLNRRERAIIRTKEYRLSDYIYHARHNRNKRF